jgi:hypothetical protein
MKKGDIVQLKAGEELKNTPLFQEGSERLKTMDRGKIPVNFTVSGVWTERVCCSIFTVMSFEEIPGIAFSVDHFDVILEAGEPDLTELLKHKEDDRIKQAEFSKTLMGMY